jgi:hypothetical protein
MQIILQVLEDVLFAVLAFVNSVFLTPLRKFLKGRGYLGISDFVIVSLRNVWQTLWSWASQAVSIDITDSTAQNLSREYPRAVSFAVFLSTLLATAVPEPKIRKNVVTFMVLGLAGLLLSGVLILVSVIFNFF